MANTRTRKSGKLFTGIIAFLLGFIFAIVVEVAVIAGGAYFVLSTPLDNLLGLLPDGNDDGKGNQIIDTTGDIKTALDLIEEISEIAGKGENMALGDIIKLSPALDNYLEELYGELGKNYGIYLDGEEIKAQTVSSIGTYVTETVVPNINVYQVASATGMADGLLENPIVKVVLMGSEAKYVVNGDDSYIVYYDEYVYDGAQGVYVRYEQPAEVEAAAARPDEKYPQGVDAQKWLTETNRTTEEGEAIYRQYFYSDAEGRYTVTAKGDDGEYIYTEWSAQVDYPASYGSAPLGYTGCYYVDEKGDNVYFPGMEVLLGNFLDNDFSYLNDMSVADLFNEMGSGEGEEGEKDIIGEVFGDVSVGDLIEGNVDFNGVINDIELTALIEADPENLVMPYIAYGITDLVKVEGQAYAYTASYTEKTVGEDGTESEVTTQVHVYLNADGMIDRVVTTDGQGNEGEEIPPTTVANIEDRMNDIDSFIDSMRITDIMDIDAGNEIMAYLGYRVTGIIASENTQYTHTASYTDENGVIYPAYIFTAEDGITITEVRYGAPDGEKVEPTTVEEIGDVVDSVSVDIFLDFTVDDAITAYIGYGITDIAPEANTIAGKTYNYTATRHYTDENGSKLTEKVFIAADGEGNITAVADKDGQNISAASADELTDRINGITEDLALGQFMDVEVSYMDANGDIQNNNIMLFTAFSVTMSTEDVDAGRSPEGYYNGSYHYFDENDEEHIYDARIYTKAAEEGGGADIVSYVEYLSGTEWVRAGGTTVDGTADQIGRLTSALTIGDVVTVTEDDGRLMNKLAGYKIDEISDAIDELYLSDAIDVDPEEDIMLYVAFGVTDAYDTGTTDQNGMPVYKGTYHPLDGSAEKDVTLVLDKVTAEDGTTSYIVVGIEDETGAEIEGTTLNGTGDRVGQLTEDMAITAFVDIDPDSAIMLYIGYGVYGAEDDGNGAITAKWKDETGAERKVIITYTSEEGVKTITSVEFEDDGTAVEGTKIADIGARVENLTEDLTIGDVVEIGEDDSRLMHKLANYKIAEISKAMDELYLSDAIDVDPDEAIILYVAFGVTDAYDTGTTDENGMPVYMGTYHPLDGSAEKDVTLVLEEVTDEGGATSYIVVGMKDASGKIEGTTLNGVGERTGQLTKDMTIGSLVEIKDNDRILSLVADSTIAELSTTITNISVQDMYADEIYGVWKEVTFTTLPDEDSEEYGYLYYTLEDGKYVLVGNGDDIVANTTYYTRGDVWKEVTFTNLPTEGSPEYDYLYYTLEDGKYVLVGNGDALKAGTTYYTRGKAKGIWYLLLYSNGKEENYTVNELGDMMTNATTNMMESSLQDFKDAGIINGTLSEKVIPIRLTSEGAPDGTKNESKGDEAGAFKDYVVKPLNLCTIDELIDAVNILSGLLDKIS